MRPSMKPAGSVPALLASFGRAASPEAGLINTAKAWLGRVRNGVLLHVVLVVLAFRRGRRQRVGRASAWRITAFVPAIPAAQIPPVTSDDDLARP